MFSNIARRALWGALAAAGVFAFLVSSVAGLSSGWFFLVPILMPMIVLQAFPILFALALPLAALLRAPRALSAAIGVAWILFAGGLIAAAHGAGRDDAFLVAAVLVPTGAALGLGLDWRKPSC